MSASPADRSNPSELPAHLPQWLIRAARPAAISMAIVALALCALTLVDNWQRVEPSIANANVALLALALAAAALAMGTLAVLWWGMLRLFGWQIKVRQALAWFFGGELGKYLPGGIWTVLGRGELAQRHGGIERSTGYATTLMCYAAMTLGAGMTLGLLGPISAATGGSTQWALGLIALVPLCLVAMSPRVLTRILRIGARLTRGRVDIEAPSWSRMLSVVSISLPAWLLVGTCSTLVAVAFGYHQHPAQTMFAAVAAWIIGFLAVPVPAGSGIREAVFVALSGLGLAEGTVVAIAARLLFIGVDGIGGLSGLVYVRVRVAGTVRGLAG